MAVVIRFEDGSESFNAGRAQRQPVPREILKIINASLLERRWQPPALSGRHEPGHLRRQITSRARELDTPHLSTIGHNLGKTAVKQLHRAVRPVPHNPFRPEQEATLAEHHREQRRELVHSLAELAVGGQAA